MKLITLFALALIACFRLTAQDVSKEWDAFTGVYRLELDSTQLFKIKKEKNGLVLDVGNGQTKLVPLGGYRFKPEQVRAATVVEFVKDSQGQVQQFKWIQDLNVDMLKKSGEKGYTGKYQLKNNPYVSIEVRETDGGLVIRQGNGTPITMHQVSTDQFVYEKDGFKLIYVFTRNASGAIQGIQIARTGPQPGKRSDAEIRRRTRRGGQCMEGRQLGCP